MPFKAIVAAIVTVTAGPALSAPAMWAISDSDSTVYLFGTSHLVRPDAAWRTPELDAAIKQSSTLWLEMKFPDPAMSAAMTQKYGLDPAKQLRSKLSPETAAKLDAFITANNLPASQIAAMRPWLAAATIARIAAMKSGLDAKSGADLTLKAAAEAEGDTVDGFDTVEQQVRYLADLPEEVQIDFLDRTLDRAGDSSVVNKTADAWEKGDLATLEDLINSELKSHSTLVYERLNVERNRRYAKEIEALLAGNETHFVAVGAGHVAGPDGIPALLKKAGVKITRIQ